MYKIAGAYMAEYVDFSGKIIESINNQNIIGCQCHFQAVSLIVRVKLIGKWYAIFSCMISSKVFSSMYGNKP